MYSTVLRVYPYFALIDFFSNNKIQLLIKNHFEMYCIVILYKIQWFWFLNRRLRGLCRGKKSLLAENTNNGLNMASQKMLLLVKTQSVRKRGSQTCFRLHVDLKSQAEIKASVESRHEREFQKIGKRKLHFYWLCLLHTIQINPFVYQYEAISFQTPTIFNGFCLSNC